MNTWLFLAKLMGIACRGVLKELEVCDFDKTNEWNKLSTDCVTASSVNIFKNKVDTYLRRAGYK